MVWIVGADALSGALHHFRGGALGRFLAVQMDHAEWEGFHFYDLIFPLFVFMVGVSITFSLDRIVARDGRAAAIRRILRRGLLLFVLGVLYYGGMSEGYTHIRLLGVLQRLALCYVATSLLYLFLRPRALVVVGLALLVAYWALLTFVPVPGYGAGDLAEGHNLANWIDARYLPLHKWKGDHDPEGLLSTLPAIVSCLIGLFAGLVLRDPQRESREKIRWLMFGGAAFLVVGQLWGLEFPVIKRIWTSSYVLVAGGWSLWLLAGFYFLIDVRGWRRWAQPFVWIGCNALTIYLVSRLVDFDRLSASIFGGEIAAGLNALWPGLGGLVLALVGIGLCVAFCGFLYRRKIFLRL